jgi:drug/metabolite transporter (DMT)-like permease
MVLAMALSGTIGLLVVESGLPALWVVWLRCLFGGLGLAAWVARANGVRPRAGNGAGWAGGVALVCNWVGLFSAYRYSSIAVATVVYHVQPFVLLVLAAVFQGEALPFRKLPWLGLALLGVALSSGLDGTQASRAPGPVWRWPWGPPPCMPWPPWPHSACVWRRPRSPCCANGPGRAGAGGAGMWGWGSRVQRQGPDRAGTGPGARPACTR